MKLLPKLAITLGDPSGIGPEIVGKAFSGKKLFGICRPIIIGDKRFLAGYNIGQEYILNIPCRNYSKIRPGNVSADGGRAAYEAILKAVELCRAGKADAMVTAPISKAALNLAGVKFAGHTELLAHLCGVKNPAMMMAADNLRTVMATRHIPLTQVSKKLSVSSIVDITVLAHNYLKSLMRIRSPRISVCSLNPHCGEGGMIGREELSIILPAVRKLRELGLNVTGPQSCDSAWQKLICGKFDLLVTMYHDQAMIGLKCVNPEKIVNITLGLPIIRTSPGHGTGADIAGQDMANPASMIEAVKTAVNLSKC